MSEKTTRQRIAAMWGEINGVRTNYANIPRALQDAALPGAVVFPGRATHPKDETEEMIDETRIYRMVLYIEKAAFGTEGQGEIDADPFFDSVLQHFAARPGLELNAEGANQTYSVFDAEMIDDGGLQVGPYPLAGQGTPDYIQIGWSLQVKEKIEVNYAD